MNDIAAAFEVLKGQVDALYVVAGALVAANRIIELALDTQLPTIFPNREFAEVGGLVS